LAVDCGLGILLAAVIVVTTVGITSLIDYLQSNGYVQLIDEQAELEALEPQVAQNPQDNNPNGLQNVNNNVDGNWDMDLQEIGNALP
jgi:hypothetical protein